MKVFAKLLLLAVDWSLLVAGCKQSDFMTAQPSLTLRSTRDLTLLCNMTLTDLRNQMDSREDTRLNFISLQISVIFNLASGEDRPLATLDLSKGARSSQYVEDLEYSGRVIKVRGRVEGGEEMWKSWLEVTMADVSQHDYGAYVCVMLYQDAAGSAEPQNKTYTMNFVSTAPPVKNISGFSMRLERGLHMKCEYITQDDVPLLVRSIYFQNETGHYLGQWFRDRVGHCLANFQCAKMHSVGMYTTKRLHWYGITCRHNKANLRCGVGTAYNTSALSGWQILTVGGCSDTSVDIRENSIRILIDNRMLKNVTNVNGGKPADAIPTGECACIIERSLLGIVLASVFVAAAYCFRHKLKSVFESLIDRLRRNGRVAVPTNDGTGNDTL